MRNLIKKIINNEDIKASAFNFTTAWAIGKTANIISNAFFHFDLDQYNSIEHFGIGVGLGTLTYRKAGKGLKGIVAGLVTATIFNVSWEYIENKYVFFNNGLDFDTISDISIVYAGTILGIVGEKCKNLLNNNYKKED